MYNEAQASRAFRHVSLILVSAWAVHVYRNAWPLALVGGVPCDISEGSLLYLQGGLLTFSGVLVPLFVPRLHKPANPKVSFSFFGPNLFLLVS